MCIRRGRESDVCAWCAVVVPAGERAGGARVAAGRGDGGRHRAAALAVQPQAPAHTRRHSPQAQAPAELLAP